MLTEAENYQNHLMAYREWIGATATIISKHLNQNVSVEAIEKRSLNVVHFEMDLAKVRYRMKL